jgi:hypothetical protein
MSGPELGKSKCPGFQKQIGDHRHVSHSGTQKWAAAGQKQNKLCLNGMLWLRFSRPEPETALSREHGDLQQLSCFSPEMNTNSASCYRDAAPHLSGPANWGYSFRVLATSSSTPKKLVPWGFLERPSRLLEYPTRTHCRLAHQQRICPRSSLPASIILTCW